VHVALWHSLVGHETVKVTWCAYYDSVVSLIHHLLLSDTFNSRRSGTSQGWFNILRNILNCQIHDARVRLHVLLHKLMLAGTWVTVHDQMCQLIEQHSLHKTLCLTNGSS
jgi:hypothetical protein